MELTIRNDGPRRSPVLEVRDEVSGTHGARLLVGPLDPGTSAAASYRLLTARRGILRIGPLEVDIDDPFGITETLRAPPASPSSPSTPASTTWRRCRRARATTRWPVPITPTRFGRSGEDFYVAPVHGRRRPAPRALAVHRSP
ncbi:MAG: hypothetical protein R2699_13745 [Acidimicrobiales bacterium]